MEHNSHSWNCIVFCEYFRLQGRMVLILIFLCFISSFYVIKVILNFFCKSKVSLTYRTPTLTDLIAWSAWKGFYIFHNFYNVSVQKKGRPKSLWSAKVFLQIHKSRRKEISFFPTFSTHDCPRCAKWRKWESLRCTLQPHNTYTLHMWSVL